MALWTPAGVEVGFWYDPATPDARVLDGTAIDQLLDRSGNGLHISAAGSQRPALVSAEQNGLDVARFSGGQILRSASADWHTGEWTVFVVAKQVSVLDSNAMLVVQDRSDSPRRRVAQYLRTSDDTTIRSIIFNSVESHASATKTATMTEFAISAAARSASDVTAYFNGAAGTPGTLSGTPAVHTIPLCIGGRERSSTLLVDFFNGDMGEIIGIPGVLPQDEFDHIIGYLAHRWGTTAGLAADHPYKNSSPGSISYYGAITDKDGFPAARTITVLDSNGQCVAIGTSDPVSGAYEITAQEQPHTLIFSGEPDRNAIVYANVMPQEKPA